MKLLKDIFFVRCYRNFFIQVILSQTKEQNAETIFLQQRVFSNLGIFFLLLQKDDSSQESQFFKCSKIGCLHSFAFSENPKGRGRMIKALAS